jgi:hypothetical protein
VVTALIGYLGEQPGICAGLLGAAAAVGRMNEALQANDHWIAGPLRDLLRELHVADPVDAANAAIGAMLFAVLGRSTARGDPNDRRFQRRLADQIVRGVVSAER